jgi:homoserine kinase type II
VLTLFEEHSADELPYFLSLMTHLSERGVPCPHPVKRLDGLQLDELNGKPAAIVSCLNGRDITAPSVNQCKELGQVLASMHIAGSTFTLRNQDSRDLEWREATAKKVLDFLDENDRKMLRETMLRQAAIGYFCFTTRCNSCGSISR